MANIKWLSETRLRLSHFQIGEHLCHSTDYTVIITTKKKEMDEPFVVIKDAQLMAVGLLIILK